MNTKNRIIYTKTEKMGIFDKLLWTGCSVGNLSKGWRVKAWENWVYEFVKGWFLPTILIMYKYWLCDHTTGVTIMNIIMYMKPLKFLLYRKKRLLYIF